MSEATKESRSKFGDRDGILNQESEKKSSDELILSLQNVSKTKASDDSPKMNHVRDASEAIYRAQIWIEGNPEIWSYMISIALNEVSNKRRFSMRGVMEMARAERFKRANNEPFKIDNSLAPGFARILVRDYPEVTPYIELRKAACDWAVDND